MLRTDHVFLFFTLLIIAISWRACEGGVPAGTASEPHTPNLIFQTGFEGGTKVVSTKNKQIDDLIGIDTTLPTPNDWERDLENHPNIGEFRIYYEGGNSTQRLARITPDPTDSSNQVLHFWLTEPIANKDSFLKGRIQADIYENTGLKEIYQSVRLYFPADFDTLKNYPERIYWLTIFELWNNPSWTGDDYPFRISINLEKPKHGANNDFFFRVYGQDKSVNNNWTSLWEEINTEVMVPIGEWITLEMYFREGNHTDGRLYMAMTTGKGKKEVIFDIQNFTHHPMDLNPDGLSDFNPMKLYTSKEVIDFMRHNQAILQVYWDDYKLWKNRRPEKMATD